MNKILLLLFALLFFAQKLDAQIDTLPPTLVCKNGLTFTIGPICLVTIWATDLIDTVFDNSSQTQIAVRKPCVGSGFPEKNNVVYSIDEFGSQTVEVWARDSSGNTSSCIANIFVGDALGSCDPGSILYFQTVLEEGIDSVVTHVKGSNCVSDTVDYQIGFGEIWGAWWSWMPGYWMAYDGFVPSTGYNYDITPSKNDDRLNGVTTYDLTLISKHILGIEPLDSPYKIIAADANQDGKVTTFDIVILRKLILGITDELPNGKSWRFIPYGHVFSNPQNPFEPPFPEKVAVPNTQDHTMGGYSFWGIKIGDVDFSADPN